MRRSPAIFPRQPRAASKERQKSWHTNPPRRTIFDMAIFKHFPIGEKMGFEFRAEAFNMFNHT
jgi:hypothetical protein